MRLAAVCFVLLATACGAPAPPQLVRDGIGLFSAEARAEAESRLRALAAQHGVWAFVITDADGDPPRMLDEPMGEADARGVRAVAALFGPDRLVGTGFSRALFDGDEPISFDPPEVNALLEGGGADEALVRIVEYMESWVDAPPEPGQPLVDVPAAPSAAPGP